MLYSRTQIVFSWTSSVFWPSDLIAILCHFLLLFVFMFVSWKGDTSVVPWSSSQLLSSQYQMLLGLHFQANEGLQLSCRYHITILYYIILYYIILYYIILYYIILYIYIFTVISVISTYLPRCSMIFPYFPIVSHFLMIFLCVPEVDLKKIVKYFKARSMRLMSQRVTLRFWCRRPELSGNAATVPWTCRNRDKQIIFQFDIRTSRS